MDELLDLHLRLREKLVERRPDDMFQKYRLLAALMDKANLFLERDQYAMAEKPFNRMEGMLNSFEGTVESELQYRQFLSSVYQGLSDIALSRNDLESSFAKLNLALPLVSGIAEELPDDPMSWRNVAMIHVALGDYYFNIGQFDVSEEHHRQAIQFHEKGITRHPDRIDLKELLGVARSRLGEVLLEQNHNQEGRVELHQAIGILEPISEDPGKVAAQEDLSLAYELLAGDDYKANRYKKAIEELEKSIQILNSSAGSRAENAGHIGRFKGRLSSWKRKHSNQQE